MMTGRISIFYGYPYNPAVIGENIGAATEALQAERTRRRDRLRFRLWPNIRASGRVLAQSIMENIDRAHIFACDLTYPNDNVSFELGYAIGRFKRIFISLDSSIIDSAREYRRHFYSTIGLGYSTYSNHLELAEQLRLERPWVDINNSVINDRYRQAFPRPERPTLLYIKPPTNTTSVLHTVEAAEASKFREGFFIDDPRDNALATLDWYSEQLMTADAVIIHLLSLEQVYSDVHNTKGSLIAGLACGLGRPLLILGHYPYESPVDYGHLLSIHATAESCRQNVSAWLDRVGEGLVWRRPRRAQRPTPTTWDLRHVSLGQHVAEHERDDLDNYFVETSPYLAALDGPTTILIGRRGTGKTAILYAIKAAIEHSARNHVTVLNPVGYELEGLIRVLQETSEFSERGFLIESLWKYLIYSEIALSVEESLSTRPIYQEVTDAEKEFLEYCDLNADVIRPPFSTRLEQAVRSLYGVGDVTDAIEQRARISEQLHETLLRDLRRHLGAVLRDDGELAILIDNLDEPWEPGAHVEQLSELIGGLLNVVQDIPRDLARSTHGLSPVDSKVTVLLRSDIFAFVQPLMAEQDKLPIQRVIWDDDDLLRRVLLQRLLLNAPNQMNDSDVWEQLFPTSVVGIDPEDFIFQTVLPRPRDVIYILKAAISYAINRRHVSVHPEDLLSAREQYSEFAFKSVLAEDDPQRHKLEGVLYEFAGAGRAVTLPDIIERMSKADVEDRDLAWYIDLLCDIGFLGISTSNGFRYSREESERIRLREIAKRLAAQAGEIEHFEINPAFYQVLQIG